MQEGSSVRSSWARSAVANTETASELSNPEGKFYVQSLVSNFLASLILEIAEDVAIGAVQNVSEIDLLDMRIVEEQPVAIALVYV